VIDGTLGQGIILFSDSVRCAIHLEPPSLPVEKYQPILSVGQKMPVFQALGDEIFAEVCLLPGLVHQFLTHSQGQRRKRLNST